MYIYKNISKVSWRPYAKWSIDNTEKENRDVYDVEKHKIKMPKGFHTDKNYYGETFFFKKDNPHGFDIYSDGDGKPFIYDDWSGELYYLELAS